MKSKKKSTPSHINLPLLPMREIVIFPGMSCPLHIGRLRSLESLNRALESNRKLIIVTQKTTTKTEPKPDDVYATGTVGNVLQVMRMPNDTVKIIFQAEYRAHIRRLQCNSAYYQATVEKVTPVRKKTDSPKIESLLNMLHDALPGYLKKNTRGEELMRHIKDDAPEPDDMVDRIAPLLNNVRLEEKQSLLENPNTLARLENLYRLLIEDGENKKLAGKIKQRIQGQIGKSHRDFYLNEQMKAIRKELGTGEEATDTDEFKTKINSLTLTDEAKEAANKELKRLQALSPYSSEANIVRNYLDWLLSVPWSTYTRDDFNLKNASKILDADHYGLEKIKERIIEFIAVSKNLGEVKGPIICLVGPPGVGKTSLAKSVARCLNRNFARISLGGIRDEAEIRGHRRTYIGAMPGKIIQMMKKSKSSNPLILLDEIDKITGSNMGDPASALLEVLDPEQNNTFMDHFLDVEYDLSKVLFLCTANSAQDIPLPLYDRMEVISVSGYTEPEKIIIAHRHLVPKQMKENGIKPSRLSFKNEVLPQVIRHYTQESGIRSLERMIGKLCRKAVTELMKTPQKKSLRITNKKLRTYLGARQFDFGKNNDVNETGVATGLAWTAYGGDVLSIEATDMRGKGGIHLTGKLGDVMKESATTALSFIRSNANRLGIYSSVFQNRDVHVHVPEGATPKDGPSAGITLATALVSLLTSIPIKREMAMTGEITLRGKVLKIGGLKEKLLAAKRAGVTDVIIPQANIDQVGEFSDEILNGMAIHPVYHVNDVFNLALEYMPKAVVDVDDANEKDTPDPDFSPSVQTDENAPAPIMGN